MGCTIWLDGFCLYGYDISREDKMGRGVYYGLAVLNEDEREDHYGRD